MAQPKQTATELSRTLAGQWSKSEKRMAAARSIMDANKRTHQILKQYATLTPPIKLIKAAQYQAKFKTRIEIENKPKSTKKEINEIKKYRTTSS